MSTGFAKESKTIDYVVSLGLEAVKDKIKTECEAKQVRGRIKEFILRQQKINWSCTRDEEIDFGGLAEYIQTNLLEDVQARLFGSRAERGAARRSIISKAVSYSQAHTSLSRQRAIWMTETAIDILREFYRSKTNRELKFIAAQIEDTVTDVTAEQTREITQVIHSSEERAVGILSDKIENIESLSVERNMRLMKDGENGQVENIISNWFDAIGSTHILFPDYRYEYKAEKRQFYSKPLTKDALEKYPPRIICTGTIQMNGEYLDRFDVNTIDYARCGLVIYHCNKRYIYIAAVPFQIGRNREHLHTHSGQHGVFVVRKLATLLLHMNIKHFQCHDLLIQVWRFFRGYADYPAFKAANTRFAMF